MAAHVLRLRFALLVGALRGTTGHTTRRVLALMLLVFATIAACWAIVSSGDSSPDALLAVTVLGGSALTFGFALAPVIGGVDDPLDPRRFSILAMGSQRLAAVLVVAGFISIPIAALLAVSITGAVVWGEQGGAWLGGAAGVVLGVTTCVLLARIFLALSSLFIRERGSQELTGLFALVVIVVAVPAGVFFASLNWDGAVPPPIALTVDVLALTPLGAAWAFPGLLAQGTDAAWPAFGVAVATVVVLAAAWVVLVRRLLTTTERPVSSRERGGLGWFGLMPSTPGGAIAARELLDWSRDRRYLVNILVIPLAAVVTVFPLLVAGVPLEIAVLVPVPFAALFLGWLPHNDLAYDSTAVWMHIASGVRGFSDRVGRLVPVVLIGIPLLAVAVPSAIALNGDWGLLPALSGVSLCLFLSALGLSSVSSVLAPYAVSRPGESPFQQPQRTGSGGAISQSVVMIGAIVLSLPVLWWSWKGLNGDTEAFSTALWGGLAIGFGMLIVGIALGSFLFGRRGGTLMEFAEAT